MTNDLLLSYLKALSDPMRLNIMNILSCGELCACEILEGLSIKQTTLSHHMKILTESGLITKRKDSTYVFYRINREDFSIVQSLINELISNDNACLCKDINSRNKKCKQRSM